MSLDAKHIALIGCGNMGGAILKAWLQKLPNTVTYTIVSNSPSRVQTFLQSQSVSWIEAGDALPKKPDYILIAVKPQVLAEALPPYGDHDDTLYVTIAAGKSTSFYTDLLGSKKLVRWMPNMPAAVGRSATTAYTNSPLTPAQTEEIQQLAEAFGSLHWLDTEDLFHATTAIAGSGPAYVFLLVEALTQAGLQNGLEPPLAEALARQTLIGSGVFLDSSSDTAETLRHQVTSPGGTTEAALTLLQEELPDLMARAVERAIQRSKEL